jgi:hypothetical protein
MMRHCSKLLAITAVQLIVTVASADQRVNEQAEILKGFTDRVKQYLDLQKKAEAHLSSLHPSDRPENIEAHTAALAEGIRAARMGARPGDVFNGAAEQFRRIIEDDAKNRSSRDAYAAMQEVPRRTPPKVNVEYPENAALATVPPLILKRLPLLPEGLEYRFMGRDLILRDVKSNLIVDFIREAVPTVRR